MIAHFSNATVFIIFLPISFRFDIYIIHVIKTVVEFIKLIVYNNISYLHIEFTDSSNNVEK